MSRFLEPGDVEKLTGRKQAAAQLRWCVRNGVRAWFNGFEVVIPVSAIDGKPAVNEPIWTPDPSALKG